MQCEEETVYESMMRTSGNSLIEYPESGPGQPMKHSWLATPRRSATTLTIDGEKAPSTKTRSTVSEGNASSRTEQR